MNIKLVYIVLLGGICLLYFLFRDEVAPEEKIEPLGDGASLVPSGIVPVFMPETKGNVYYKADTDEIIDGNDLILLGEL